ncbi:hypothetical protein [Sandaracinus amylolyticus]|uniref:CENP-V/GFA domain-containing protein n=1 Tax=Sandaracinus amylolyticus TaxID=927083 RepID=A0A0F6W9B5_9BACT|nr:hypothetical protein [Sandaracinus amylolyticus]AKF10762.1 hypothetical protein DB32_007911 [Sandaracinus amylolyticus]
MTTTCEGACHCGAIGYVLRTEVPHDAITLRTCGCSFCAPRA